MNTITMRTRRLGRTDFLHLGRQPVRLAADCGTLWVTQDGEPEDIQIDAGQMREFDGHAVLTVGTLGGGAQVRVTPLTLPPRQRLERWFGTWLGGARA